jgi:hypothetical protein
MAKKLLSGSDFIAPLLLNGSAGTSGQVLTSQGVSAIPIWTDISSSGGGLALADLSAVSPIVYNNTTGVFSLDKIDGGTP